MGHFIFSVPHSGQMVYCTTPFVLCGKFLTPSPCMNRYYNSLERRHTSIRQYRISYHCDGSNAILSPYPVRLDLVLLYIRTQRHAVVLGVVSTSLTFFQHRALLSSLAFREQVGTFEERWQKLRRVASLIDGVAAEHALESSSDRTSPVDGASDDATPRIPRVRFEPKSPQCSMVHCYVRGSQVQSRLIENKSNSEIVQDAIFTDMCKFRVSKGHGKALLNRNDETPRAVSYIR